MSTTSQGPRWWLASDGRWYPPDQHPGSQFPERPTTSGFAVASLVLSVVWIGGLGSLLGVIFGFAAKRDIKKSRGAKSGSGLATAEITLGFLGIASLALFVTLAAVVTLPKTPPPLTVPFGTAVKLPVASNGDFRSMTVFSLTTPAPSRVSGSAAGSEVVTARMQLCAGRLGTGAGGNTAALALSVYFAHDENGLIDPDASVGGMGRNLNNLTGLAPNQCATGYAPSALLPEPVR